MVTIKRLAALCTAIYAYPGYPAQQWDHFDPGTDDAVCWALSRDPDGDCLVFRGSDTFKDWIHDGELYRLIGGRAALDVAHYPLATSLHYGFGLGLMKMWSEARALLRPRAPLFVTGHSLGAGRAAEVRYMAAVDGIAVAGTARFGEPASMYATAVDFLSGAPAAADNSFQNRGSAWFDVDHVTGVPWPPFLHPVALIPVDASPTGDAFDRYGLFARHHMPLYEQAAPDVPADQQIAPLPALAPAAQAIA